MSNLHEAIKNRRTNYALGRNMSVSNEQIVQAIESVVHEVPSAFNMQSGRVIVAFGEKHDAIWRITHDTLAKIVPPENFASTDKKIQSFAAAYGTVLYFEKMDVVESMQQNFPLYADNFHIWAQQANGMLQFAIWTALADLGLGVNLQQYNPWIDDEVKQLFQVAQSWKLIAKMPFGARQAEPAPIQKRPVKERVQVFES